MTTGPDYLALIAAKMVECIDPEYPLDMHTYACLNCAGSGRVLDPRFGSLRMDNCGCEDHKGQPQGYTVNRDLAVLLKCLRDDNIAYKIRFHPDAGPPCVELGVGGRHWGYSVQDDFYQAVWEWLEQEEKVTTNA